MSTWAEVARVSNARAFGLRRSAAPPDSCLSIAVFSEDDCDDIEVACADLLADGDAAPLPTTSDGWPLSEIASAVALVNGSNFRYQLDGFHPLDPPLVRRVAPGYTIRSTIAFHATHPTRKLRFFVEVGSGNDHGFWTGGEKRGDETVLRGSCRIGSALYPMGRTAGGAPSIMIEGSVHGPTFT